MQAFTCLWSVVPAPLDDVFKALADPTRRLLLDRLHEANGQTLAELSAPLGMARQSASQHLRLLEDANLVATVRRGREKLHYLNPVPLHEIHERWIHKFETPRLDVLRAVGHRAQEGSAAMSDRPDYVYVTYIRATPEQVWHALTDADLTARYWGHANLSDWQEGSTWKHVRTDGSDIADVIGTVIEAKPPTRLVTTFDDPTGARPHPPATVTFTIEPGDGMVRLTVVHEGLRGQEDRDAVALGWPAVLSNLKSLLETGEVLPEAPWAMTPR
jgi:uncharacterized protein YndB with AHSA1/START domain/DNA-binding transcriptional ArsR family regulator